jgi:hypothetical protein
MVNKIIEQMRSQLYENANCINDFEKYDVPEIKKSLEFFFWSVREYGTSLCHIGPTRMNRLFENEASRFQIFRDKNAPICGIKYWEDNGKTFFFDGFRLVNVDITSTDIDVIYANIWYGEIERLKEKYPAEYEMRNKPLEIRMEEQVAERLEKSKEFANSVGDTSLEDCLTRLSKHSRLGVDHYISLSPDFSEHGYIFCEYLNNECRMSGGIIYHGNPKEGYKENSSVQLNPSYGWSIHT